MPLHMPEPVPPPILATGPNRSYRKSSRSEDESSLTPPKRKNTKKVESGNNLDTYLQIPATWNGMNSQRVFLTALLPSEINFGDEKYYADQAGASSDNQILVPPKMPRYQDIEYDPGN